MSAQRNPRAFIDMNGGYQSHREGIDKEAHDAWVKTNTWNLTRDDFIRLSYFHGSLEDGDDGRASERHPMNGSIFQPGDVVYISETDACLTRSMVSYWLAAAPKDGNEFLAVWGRQGNVVQVVKWNRLHKFWQSKGEPIAGFATSVTAWHPLPALSGSAESKDGAS